MMEGGSEPFGEWLLKQSEYDRWTGKLARAAKCDPDFPKNATPDEVRGRFHELMAGTAIYEAIDDAETDWVSDRTNGPMPLVPEL